MADGSSYPPKAGAGCGRQVLRPQVGLGPPPREPPRERSPAGGFVISSPTTAPTTATATATPVATVATSTTPAAANGPGGPHPGQPVPAGSQVARSKLFCDTFDPSAGGDYRWLLDRAKEAYREADAAFAAIDAKAAAVVNHFGSGAGLAAFAALAGVATDAITPAVAGCAAPSFAAAVVAMVFAVLARQTTVTAIPPPPHHCHEFVGYRADRLPDDPAKAVALAEFDTIALWEAARMKLRAAADGRGWWLTWAIRLKVTAIGLLLFPLAVAVWQKFAARPDDPKPLRVQLVAPADPPPGQPIPRLP